MSLSSPTIVVSAATTLTKDQSGCTVSADASGAYTITLPSTNQPFVISICCSRCGCSRGSHVRRW